MYPKFSGLLRKCFAKNPNERPKIAEVMKEIENCREEFGAN